MEDLIDNLEIKQDTKEKRNLFLIVFSVLFCLTNFIVCFFSYIEIRSIIISVFVLGGFSLVEIIAALSVKKKNFLVHGLIGVFNILIVILIINALNISPKRAETKLPVFLFLLALFHFAFTLFILIIEPKKRKLNL